MNEETALGTKDFLERRLTAIKNQRSTGELEDLALIIGQLLLWHLSSCWMLISPPRWQELNLCPREGDIQGLFGIGHVVQGCYLLYVPGATK